MEEKGIQINGGITTNIEVSVKSTMYVKKIIFGILHLVTCSFENGEYLANIMYDLAITCDEIIK